MYGQITTFIKDLGFPIFVVGYFLIYFRKRFKKNIEASMELIRRLRSLNQNRGVGKNRGISRKAR